MKITMYGAEICPDCVEAKSLLSKNSNIELDYRNITESTSILKEFLSYRDNEKMFDPIKENGKIGIPLFILEDGSKTFELSDIIDTSQLKENSSTNLNSCSLDGRGNC